MCYFIFIYVHLLSFFFIFHFFLFIFMSFHFCSFPVFFSLEKTITNLNHLHVDPRLSSADRKCFFASFSFALLGQPPLLPKPPLLRQLLLSFSLSVDSFFVKQWQLQFLSPLALGPALHHLQPGVGFLGLHLIVDQLLRVLLGLLLVGVPV